MGVVLEVQHLFSVQLLPASDGVIGFPGDGTLSYADLSKDLSKPYEEEKQDEEEESHGFEYQAHLARKGIKRIKKEKDILKLTIEKSKVHLEELEEKLAIMKKDQSRMFQVRVAP